MADVLPQSSVVCPRRSTGRLRNVAVGSIRPSDASVIAQTASTNPRSNCNGEMAGTHGIATTTLSFMVLLSCASLACSSSPSPSSSPQNLIQISCCDGSTDDCPACEWTEANHSCQQLLHENAICGGDCCAFEDNPGGGCKVRTGGNGSCCVKSESNDGAFLTLQHSGAKHCPVSQYLMPTSVTQPRKPSLSPTQLVYSVAFDYVTQSPTPSSVPDLPPVEVPSSVPWSSGFDICCDEPSDDCSACESYETRSCQQLLDENAICGGDCCALHDTPGGGCKWSTGGNGYCCMTIESGNQWNLQHAGTHSCPVSQYSIPNTTPTGTGSPAEQPTPSLVSPTLLPGSKPFGSFVPSSIPLVSGLETCCDEASEGCRLCEWIESRSCQQLLDEDAICGGDCCALEDTPTGGCKWSTGGNGYCCVRTESGSLWNLQHLGTTSCPVSQYPISKAAASSPTISPTLVQPAQISSSGVPSSGAEVQPNESIVPTSIPRASDLETCCDEASDSCRMCEWFETRSCQQLLDENAICGGDCCALEDTSDGGCKWSTGGNGYCCMTTESGNQWNLQHAGTHSCPVSQYSIPNTTPTSDLVEMTSPTAAPPSLVPRGGAPALLPEPTPFGSVVPSSIPLVSGLEMCCDEASEGCRLCEWIESRTCQQLLDEDAICGGDCCALEDTPTGGCKWSTGGNGYCCVRTESGSLWNLQHVGTTSCPVSQYAISNLTASSSSPTYAEKPPTSVQPTPSLVPSAESPSLGPEFEPESIAPSTITRASGLETCCDEPSDSCRMCEWFETRSCQQLLDENAICGGDCCALEDTPDGGCKWSTGGNGYCCMTTESGSLWNLQHLGTNSCPVSEYYTGSAPTKEANHLRVPTVVGSAEETTAHSGTFLSMFRGILRALGDWLLALFGITKGT